MLKLRRRAATPKGCLMAQMISFACTSCEKSTVRPPQLATKLDTVKPMMFRELVEFILSLRMKN